MQRTQEGFSLVELLIVVAIIGILAAIAVPNFIAMQHRAKRAELPGNVEGIKSAQQAYFTAFDEYLDLGASPAGNPSKVLTAWLASDANWATLGWRPAGDVRGLYSAITTAQCAQDPTVYVGPTFCVTAASDIDGNGDAVEYYAGPAYNATIQSGYENVY
ncbi:MAG: type II secretion system protein [Pseudomonadota bacterium]|nr:type II secretion system protein [Pseudomonadota bacterium]